jgi:glycosyltransferase involved in cell wall biosynthesis
MRVTFGEIATARPMGQQAYERAIQQALADLSPETEFRRRTVTTLRSGVSSDRRIPWRLLDRLPAGVAAATLGRWAYGSADVVHRLDLRLPPAPGPEVVTAHDLPPMRFPDEGTLPGFLASGARRPRVVIVPSTFAAQELVELLGVEERRIRVIPYGLTATYATPPEGPERDLRTPPGPFVVHAAGATLRKNLKGLADAWAALSRTHPDHHLVLCGPEDERRTSLFGNLPRVHLVGRLPANDVAWLMHRAAAVVVPSIYEGFGLPALEGMAAGVPVVAARRGALPEVCADAALLVEPSGSAIADGLRRVFDDQELAADLRARGPARARTYSWRRAAEAHMDAYEQAIG